MAECTPARPSPHAIAEVPGVPDRPRAAGERPAAPLGLEEFAALMAPLGPFGPAPRIAAGVSGGPDSLALALLAAGWAARRGGSLLALVADHGLRPGSDAEAAGVVAQLAARGIAARLLSLGLAAGPGLQARARAARHAALLGACAAAGIPWLLLGHHRDDQAETLLFRALRGSGPGGLAAIAPLRAAAEALVLRPLLGVAPARLAATVAAAGLSPVRDPSNGDPRFARARLRAVLDPPAREALAEAATGFARRRARREAAVVARLVAAVRLLPDGEAEIDRATLGEDSVADAALGALIRVVGGGAYAPRADAVAALRRRGTGTLGGCWLRPQGRLWRLVQEPAAVSLAARADGRFRMAGAGDGAGPPSGPAGAGLPAPRCNGVLAASPSLDYRAVRNLGASYPIYAPAAGPVTGSVADA